MKWVWFQRAGSTPGVPQRLWCCKGSWVNSGVRAWLCPLIPLPKPVWSAGCPSAAGQQCSFQARGPESKVNLPDSSLSSECKRLWFLPLCGLWANPGTADWESGGGDPDKGNAEMTVHVEPFLCYHRDVLCSYPALLSNALVMNPYGTVNAV